MSEAVLIYVGSVFLRGMVDGRSGENTFNHPTGISTGMKLYEH